MVVKSISTVVIINFHGGKKSISTVLKINFFLLCQAQISVLSTRARVTLTFDWLAFAVKLVLALKINFFLLCQAQISALATRARVTLSLDWLAFAVKLVLVGSCIWKIATKTSFTVNANQSNESATRACVASADICA